MRMRLSATFDIASSASVVSAASVVSLASVLFLAAAATPSASAQGIPVVPTKPQGTVRDPQTGEEAVKVAVAVVGEAKPGGTVRIAATFGIVPGWHIYWENPGESGSPTTLELDLPEGCTVAKRADGRPAVDFPVPSVFSHGETTFGYEKSVTISVEVQLPATLPAGGIPVKVRTRWLVCKERCLMGSGEASVDLAKPVAAESAPARALAESLARLPKPLPPGWRLSVAEVAAESATLVVQAPPDFSADGEWSFIPNDTPGCLLESGYLATAKGRLLRVPLMLSRESASGRPLEVAGLLILGKNGASYAFRLPIPAP